MGFEPTIFSVTGRRVYRATPRPHILALASNFHPTKICLKCRVPAGGVAPPSRVYESLVLTLELRRRSEEMWLCVFAQSHSPNEPAKACKQCLRRRCRNSNKSVPIRQRLKRII